MAIPYRLVTDANGVSTVTADVTGQGDFKTINSVHPNFDVVLAGLKAGDKSVLELFDVAGGLMKRFRKITDRVSFDGTNILLDGDVMHSVLTEQLLRLINAGPIADQHVQAIAKFWEKLESNPNEHSREQAYDFLATHNFQITLDGDVVGYKGVYAQEDGTFLSTWKSEVSGKPSAYVDGVAVEPRSQVPNNPGTVVSMPRSEVVHDPSQACRRGLHVSTRSYAGSYGTVVMEVHFNPRDICSVPTDGGGEKVRVNRYMVKGVASDVTVTGPVLDEPSVPDTWKGDVGYNVASSTRSKARNAGHSYW